MQTGGGFFDGYGDISILKAHEFHYYDTTDNGCALHARETGQESARIGRNDQQIRPASGFSSYLRLCEPEICPNLFR